MTFTVPFVVAAALVSGIAAAAVGIPTAATAVPLADRDIVTHLDESWADSQHGWKAGCGGICATDDGGRTWRRVRIPPGGLSLVVRTSATAGVIAGDTPGVRRYWTRDGGRTWHRTSAISGVFQGNANYLFSIVPCPAASLCLARVTPWPPTSSKLHVHIVWTPPADTQIGGNLANVPGGVATLLFASFGSPLRLGVLIYRSGDALVTDLPQDGLPAGTDYLLDESLSTDWPDLYVTACALADTSPNPTPLGAPIWHSNDGGHSWLAGSTEVGGNCP